MGPCFCCLEPSCHPGFSINPEGWRWGTMGAATLNVSLLDLAEWRDDWGWGEGKEHGTEHGGPHPRWFVMGGESSGFLESQILCKVYIIVTLNFTHMCIIVNCSRECSPLLSTPKGEWQWQQLDHILPFPTRVGRWGVTPALGCSLGGFMGSAVVWEWVPMLPVFSSEDTETVSNSSEGRASPHDVLETIFARKVGAFVNKPINQVIFLPLPHVSMSEPLEWGLYRQVSTWDLYSHWNDMQIVCLCVWIFCEED